MLSWIPILGPIIQGIISIFTKKMDTDVEKLKTTRSADVEEAKVSAEIIKTTQDSIGVRMMRDLICFPVAVWSALIGWDTIVAVRFPEWKFGVANYPDTVGYIPYAVMVFLLGNIGINMFTRR